MALVENSSNVGFQLNSSDEESAPVKKIRRRVQQFSDSDTEKENVRKDDNKTTQDDKSEGNSDSESENNVTPLKSGLIKSRIQLNGNSSDSDSPSRIETTKNEEQQMRMKNKRNKMKDKFKGLLKSRGMKSSKDESNEHSKSSESSHSEVSDPSDNEMSSVAKIKQKIRKSMATMSNICDPDTSDEESEMNKSEMPKQKPRKQQKSTKLIEAKPVRMSAKQAMENMQLIKSESNRMLREKAVSLPYHRPKALSLKDIMSRRKPAVASDGKALPIKMNEEQLKHYALLLEQRQKEMMELCKSESDEETAETEEKNDEIPKSTEEASSNTNTEHENVPEKAETPIESAENDSTDVNMVAANNDESYNELIQKEVDNTSTDANISNDVVDSEKQVEMAETNEQLEDTEKNDSNTDFKLVYNDSVEEENIPADQSESVCVENNLQNDLTENNEGEPSNSEQPIAIVNTELESQLISLHFTENNTEEDPNKSDKVEEVTNETEMDAEDKNDDFFSDDDVNMEDIDRLIENAEIMKDNDNVNSPMLIRDPLPPNAKPKLTGAPGMVIDLDGGGFMPKKSGVELLKERFTYFARLKTPEEIEREKEKKLKPGAQHLKLKQELEEKIAEQRSLEWAKRLEEEKQQHMEMETILDDADDSFEKIEAKLDENDKEEKEDSGSESGEEEPEENDIEIKDKPRKHNAMLDEEAEESDCEGNEEEAELSDKGDNEELEGDDAVDQDDDDEEESSDDESSESEVEEPTKVKKGRILKAFEDSDDEEVITKPVETVTVTKDSNETNEVGAAVVSNDVQSSSQDDVIQLAQRHQSASDDLFTSQESSTVIEKAKDGINTSDEVLGTQTFSILDSTTGCNNTDLEFKTPSQINVLCMSQPYKDPSVDAIVVGSQLPITQSSQSQPIGEDILALCTGKFYDNEFVSPSEINQYVEPTSQDLATDVYFEDTQPNKPETIDDLSKEDTPLPEIPFKEVEENKEKDKNSVKPNKDGNLLKSILDELDDPEFDKPKANRFFTGGTQKKDNEPVVESTQMKKKFTIDSDDDDEPKETNLESESNKRKKKLKKKKPEKRALQISDDEEEEEEMEQEEDDYVSDLEEETERLVEYDSEENEIEVKADKPKKKRKVTDFFEQEAELTSEDEWVGSGDEDEKGLDRMEREAGDDEVFHQGKLRRELGQIHMRDVLDQDKREVRIIQELLFEDGDLGDGHRQRKFRWRNAGDDDEVGTVPDEFADTQEEEFESEEQWRKQRHEREVFLRQMQQEEEGGNLNVTVNRTTIIKANLSSKSMSTLLQEVNQVNKEETTEAPAPVTLKRKADTNLGTPKLMKKMKMEEKQARPKSSLLDHLNL
ncbi:hypothetical protein B5X24_HaOG206831 [Helicoverpa armigera]|uniref:Claspin n=1 Tax=Helicoverpa armigera TaxID=29058 RepID=A0A2W1BQ41_HELAM|nr:hypothetical protein B5X24_HaOG206831 [Helicoverpa armigera]